MLILVDGSNLAYRAVHSAFSDQGYYSLEHSIYNFVDRLAKIVSMNNLEYAVIVAWDQGIPEFRKRIYPEYKSNRTSSNNATSDFKFNITTDPRITKDFDSVYNALIDVLSTTIMPNCNCMSLRVPNVEADDIIAYICNKVKNQIKLIVSSDRDLLQLVDENTSVYSFNSANIKTYDYDWVYLKYQDPKWFREEFLLQKAILGDTSDNIIGIDKVGEKTSKQYAKEIIKSQKLGSSLIEAINLLERPKGASKIGLENIKNGIETIKTNISIMDLYLPIVTNEPFIKDISKAINIYNNVEIDYYSAMDKLDKYDCFTKFDTIYESNCAFDHKVIIKDC